MARREDARRDAARRDAAARGASSKEGNEAADRSGGAGPGRTLGRVSPSAAGTRPLPRFPIPGYGESPDLGEVNPASTGVGLPHWAAPPTGEVPLIVPTTRAGGPAGQPPSGTARRGRPDERVRAMAWRDRDADWDDLEPLGGGDGALGALDEQRGDPGEMFSFENMDAQGSRAQAGRTQAGYGPGDQAGKEPQGVQAPGERGAPRGTGQDRSGIVSPDLPMAGGFGVRADPMLGPQDDEPAAQPSPSRRITLPSRMRPLAPSLGRPGEAADGGNGDEGDLDPGDPDLRRPGGHRHRGGSAQPGEETHVGSSGLIRTTTGIGIGVLLLLAFKVGPPAALALVTILVTMATAELYGVLRKARYQPATLLGLLATVCLMVAVYLKGEAAIGVVVALTMGATLLWYLIGVERGRPTANLAATVLGFLWVGFLGSYAALLISPALFPNRHGEAFFLGAVIATVAYDVGALVAGSRLGRHPLAPSASPNKTWEGMAGGIALCLLISALVVGRIHPWDTANAFGLGLIVCVVAPLGDLCESVVKRDLGIKDMGAILPGHGGVLDRLDALLFVVPATFYFVRALHVGVG